jgi:hypothetical protein
LTSLAALDLVSFLRFTVLPALWSAFRGLRQSPFRSFIVLQGIVWATVLGILPPAVIRGSREAAVERAGELGSNRVLVYEEPGGESRLTWQTAAGLRDVGWQELESVSAYGLAETEPPLLLTDSATPRESGRALVKGRWFKGEELSQGAPVCLLSQRLAGELFGARDPIGKLIEIPGSTLPGLEVVGVFSLREDPTAGLDNFGYEKDHPLHGLVQQMMVYMGVMPRDFAWLRDEGRILAPAALRPEVNPTLLKLEVTPEKLAERIGDLRKLLIREGIRPVIVANPVVQVLFSGPLKTMEKMHTVIFVICLLVGSIVVANSVTLTLLERKREIAVRRVEGATTYSIAVQFVVETGTVCFIGSLLGIPLALALAWIRTSLDPSGSIQWMFPVAESLKTILAVGCFGLLGGIIPALKAARVQPVEILSHE